MISKSESELLTHAVKLGHAKCSNDAKRGGKLGEHYLITKYFTTNSMRRKIDVYEREIQRKCDEFNRKLATIPATIKIRELYTISDVGSIIVNGESHSNYYGDGENVVEIVKVDANEFKNAEFVTRRQLYNPNNKIEIVKFDNPQTITIAECDCNPECEIYSIDNVIGYAIWSKKMKIYTK
jgi:hypothetical protein